MAQIKGLAAAKILNQEDVIMEFADENNPIPVQVLSRLTGFILNNDDDFAIKKEYREKDVAAGGAMLRIRLMQQYRDQPENFSLKQFIDVLDHFNTKFTLRNLLTSKCNYVVSREGQGTSVSHTDSEMINDIKAYLQLMCENVRKVWGRLLNETSLERCFVEPEIVEEEIGEDGKRRKKATGKSVSNYKELFDIDTMGDRIIIEGDPGIGKTTYVNKLAFDWTWDNGSEHFSDDTKFLQSKFKNIFLIPLRSLNGGRATTFAQAASTQLRGCGTWLSSNYEARPTKCLLILDAFDEYDGSCQEINEIINGSQFPRLKVIITTRPSHLGKLENRNQWLSIAGLTTREKRERFLIKQGWDKLPERDMIINILSSCGVLWHTPLYLTMLCVLYKLKNVTGFDPRNPNCFHVLVTLFTDRIISHKSKEGVAQLKSEERGKLKSYLQKCAFDQFSESHPWIAEVFATSASTSDSKVLRELSGQFGLLIIREEENLITGERVESVSFVHQIFLEYYAAIEFGTIFSRCRNKKIVMKIIEKNLDVCVSPFSYFLASECRDYKEMLIKGQEDKILTRPGVHYYMTKFMADHILPWVDFMRIEEDLLHVDRFPWIPQVQISTNIHKYVPMDDEQRLKFCCNKSFWLLDYVKELCFIAKPRTVEIRGAVLGYHDQSLDYILSSVKGLELVDCDCEHVNLDKQYANLTKVLYDNRHHHIYSQSQAINDAIAMLRHFPNLHQLGLHEVNNTNESVNLLCDSLQNMNQLQELKLDRCFKSPQSVQHLIQLAETMETSSLCQSLKKLKLSNNILDTETESSSGILMRAISKCVHLEELCFSNSSKCYFRNVQQVIQLAQTIETSTLHQTLKKFSLFNNILDTWTESSSDILMRAISKCVRLEILDLSCCKIKVQFLDITKEVLHNSPHLKKNLKELHVGYYCFFPRDTVTKEHFEKWKSDIKLISPHCYVKD